jgi:polysaccharide export outer membrane protein
MKNRKFPPIYGAVIVAVLLLPALSANGQKPADPASTTAATSNQTSNQTGTPRANNPFANVNEEPYRIGPGDVLDIRILNRANLSRDAVRVEGNGTIRMPLIDAPIQAACFTESELAKEIATSYLKFYRNPQVDVFIKEFKSSQVAIIGFVGEQGRYQLQRRIRLLELLTYAKGTATNAGQVINVIHSPTAKHCHPVDSDKESGVNDVATFRLSDTLSGLDEANPYLENGDIIYLPPADEVYVVGDVLSPRTIPLKEPITVSRAIAMAGGLGKDSKKDKIRVVRQERGSTTKQEIFVDLGAIEKKKAEDIALLPNDIVDVPTSGAKSLMRSLMGTIAPAVSQMPVRVIP